MGHLHNLVIVSALFLGCSRLDGAMGGAVGGVNPVGVPDQPPSFAEDAGAAELAPDALPPAAWSCIDPRVLPSSCNLSGDWSLTHSQPDSPCPFGASRHWIRLLPVEGRLCLEPVADFQRLALSQVAGCSVVLSGQHDINSTSENYTQTWTSNLTFASNGGTGETLVVVTGANNCMRKFQTTIARR